MIVNCAYEDCGKQFEQNRKDQRYCCANHRSYASRSRSRKAAAAAAVKRESTVDSMIKQLAVIAPKTASKMIDFREKNGIECTDAALRLCLMAYQEAGMMTA